MSIKAAIAPTPLPQDVQDLLSKMKAYEPCGYKPLPHTYELYVNYNLYARFQASASVSDTVQAALQAMYAVGIEEGVSRGEKSTQEQLRNLLGLSERSTDGHSRTVVIED